MTEQLFHFARIDTVPDWLRLGWIARPILDGTHHGQWSVAVEWLCKCPVVKPESELNAVMRKFAEQREARNEAELRRAFNLLPRYGAPEQWRDTGGGAEG